MYVSIHHQFVKGIESRAIEVGITGNEHFLPQEVSTCCLFTARIETPQAN